MTQEQTGLAPAIIEFCRFARASGISAGMGESVDALAMAHAVGVRDRQVLRIALRAVLCSSKEHWDLFDDIFEDFWSNPERKSRISTRSRERGTAPREDHQQSARSVATLLGQAGADRTEEDGGRAVLGATAYDRLKRADFSEVSQPDIAELERLSLGLLRQMSLRLSRKLQ